MSFVVVCLRALPLSLGWTLTSLTTHARLEGVGYTTCGPQKAGLGVDCLVGALIGRLGVARPMPFRHDGNMAITEGSRSLPQRVGFLPPNSCKARYGVGYVRTVCSQAGVGFDEASPDEDYQAVDATIKFPFANASVQIKCTSQFRIAGNSASWPAEVEWRQIWRQSLLPVYFILVILDIDERLSWLVHPENGTFHRAAAFWTRVDTDPGISRINVPKTQRLTVETMDVWAADVLACFAPREAVL